MLHVSLEMRNVYAALVRSLGRTRAFAWAGSRVLHRLDRPFARSARSVTSLGTGFPLCYLTVPGAAAACRAPCRSCMSQMAIASS